MNGSVYSIYQSKLGELLSVVQAKSSKGEAAAAAFSDLLSSIQQQMGIAETNQFSAYSAVSETPKLSTSRSTPEIEAAIEAAAQETGVDADLIRGVIMVESSFRPNAVSGAGAQGLMQLMPGTAKEMGVEDPFDPYQNVLGGAGYLKKLLKRFGDVRLALAAYSRGQGRISRLGVTDPDDPEQYSKLSSGTRGYIDKVLKYYEHFRSM